MLHIVLLLSLMIEPTQTIKLETNNRYLASATFNRVQLGKDNTFMASAQYQLWHWDENGKLINQLGAKGEGPGEVMFLGQVLWTGDYYWVIDSRKLQSSVFDKKGRYLYRKPLYYRQFVDIDGELFVLDYSKVNQMQGNYPPTLQKIELKISETELRVTETPLLFKKVSEMQVKFSYNFKLLWGVREGDTYLIVDQLEPKQWRYSPEVLAQESKVSLTEPFEPPSNPMQASRWVDPPENGLPPNTGTDREFMRWWVSWSRVNFFGRLGEDYLLAYEVPNEEFDQESLQVVQRIGKDGRAKGNSLVLEGAIMGVRDEMVYVFVEEDTEEGYAYYVHGYRI